MFAFLADSHRRHLLLTLAVGVGLVAYVTGAARSIYDFDLAMLLALIGGFPTYSGAVTGLLRRKMTADLAVALAAMAALWVGWRGNDPSSWFLVAAEVIFIMLVGESLEDFAIGRTRSGIAGLLWRYPPAVGSRAGFSRCFDRHGGKGGPHQRGPGVPVSGPGRRPPPGGRATARRGGFCRRSNAARHGRRGAVSGSCRGLCGVRRRSPACGSTCNRWRSRWRAHGK